MQSVAIALAMLAAVLASSFFIRLIPLPLPLPLVQIFLGILIAGVFQEGVTLDPEVFFLLFLPPLLFLDGWRLPKDALRRDWLPIVLLAFGLVFITVLGLGYVIHWMIPVMPLPVAFALAAIVSPTDSVALSGIARRLPIPERVASVLEGEALFNDASGLVAFQAAVLATVTGSFAVSKAVSSFFWVASVGLASGAVTALAIVMLRDAFTRRFGDEPGSEVLLSLLTPFAAYFIAEWLDASGILAAVVAGLVMGYTDLSTRQDATTRVRRHTVWEMLQFTLNGIIFVLLGEQLPDIFRDAVSIIEQTGHHSPWWIPIYALVICLTLALFRFVWAYAAMWVTQLFRRKPASNQNTYMRSLLILSAGGVRGAITLAGVMTLPLTLSSGEPFPGRELAILLAATTIIVSLLVATISLPLLLRGAPKASNTQHHLQHDLAWRSARDAARTILDKETKTLSEGSAALDSEIYAALSERILTSLDEALGEAPSDTESEADAMRRHAQERHLRQLAAQAARDALFDLARQRKISDGLAQDMVRRLDLDELRLY
ncbi:Na+/H+ antiporter [Pusillimonas sp. CC-YST705]|uniref:Na+/H+ antiporter n=2 Tax=Mesopusillimonas faecipullorum TaxID=2755040 RepID=A0ABS8C9F7_9BURK|nr:Na+/H+ antiporter [Mesopusillimonas faecipullorum]